MWVGSCGYHAAVNLLKLSGQITYSSKRGKREQYLCVLSHWDEKWKIVCRWSEIMDFFVEVLSMFSDCPVSTNVRYALISHNAIKAFYMCISSCLFPAAASASQVRDRHIFFTSLCFSFFLNMKLKRNREHGLPCPGHLIQFWCLSISPMVSYATLRFSSPWKTKRS